MTAAPALRGSPRPITGRMVLFGLLGFFGLVMSVNGVFVYFALDTWPGLGAADAYRQGLRYNDRLATARAQEALGWRSAVKYQTGELSARLSNSDGGPVRHARITVKLGRPATAAEDRSLDLAEAGGGIYRARTEALDAGLWRAELTAAGRDGERFHLIHEFVVAP